jgi:CII-binding regulator of phage lambda lysogenization HflD
VKYDPGVKFQVEETGKIKEEVNDELIKYKENITQLKEEINKKKAIIKELKAKKSSVKNLIQRNKFLY